MSAHAIKLACWSLRFWHDYLLITCCKLRGVGLAAHQGLLAACLPTKLAHKASKNNFIGKSSSEGRGRAKQKSRDSLTSSCPNIHTCSKVSNIHLSRIESSGSFSSRKPYSSPHFLQIQPSTSSPLPYPFSIEHITIPSVPQVGCFQSHMEILGSCYNIPAN